MTKTQTLADLNELLADENATESAFHGEAIESLIRRLQFWGAGVYEPRGIEDTGLSDETLVRALHFRLPGRLSGDICNHLDPAASY